MRRALIELVELGHGFSAGQRLFQGMSFIAHAGESYAIVGPSGSGKSTLLNILAGWMTPTLGEARISPGLTRTFVFQNPVGVAKRTAVDHVALPRLALGRSRPVAHGEAKRLLARFGLSGVSDLAFKDLSGGEAQRLMLARAFAMERDVVLVDEPTAQLDTSTARQVTDTIARLSHDDNLVIIATHDATVAQTCSHVIDIREFTCA